MAGNYTLLSLFWDYYTELIYESATLYTTCYLIFLGGIPRVPRTCSCVSILFLLMAAFQVFMVL